MDANGHLRYLTLMVIILLVGCAAIPKIVPATIDTNKKIAIFFDGTSNDETSDTNVKKLHSLIKLQDRNDIATFYIEGVGAKNKVVGMATGWGIADRVKKAYSFLITEYHNGDEIYIFGFSRGAYSARILASLLYYAGVPAIKPDEGSDFVNDVYSAFKGIDDDRRARVNKLYVEKGYSIATSVKVKALVLWDTVEALGWPDYEENVNKPNSNYGDQLCNVEKAYHALSIDDDRARIFTPILLTRPHLLDDCEDLKTVLIDNEQKMHYLDNIVTEVWFSGAHADVGGGYNDSQLSGVSLNWMLRQLDYTGLLPKNSRVREDINGASHDPEHGFPWNAFYKKMHRNLWQYITETPGDTKRNLKVHDSVFNRLVNCKNKTCKHHENEFPWEKMWSACCFKKTENGYQVTLTSTAECRIEIVH